LLHSPGLPTASVVGEHVCQARPVPPCPTAGCLAACKPRTSRSDKARFAAVQESFCMPSFGVHPRRVSAEAGQPSRPLTERSRSSRRRKTTPEAATPRWSEDGRQRGNCPHPGRQHRRMGCHDPPEASPSSQPSIHDTAAGTQGGSRPATVGFNGGRRQHGGVSAHGGLADMARPWRSTARA